MATIAIDSLSARVKNDSFRISGMKNTNTSGMAPMTSEKMRVIFSSRSGDGFQYGHVEVAHHQRGDRERHGADADEDRGDQRGGDEAGEHRVHALHEHGQRVEAVHVRVEELRRDADQRQDDAERKAERGRIERRIAGVVGALGVDEIAWMMNCVEKIAPTVPKVQAKIVAKPILPSQVK